MDAPSHLGLAGREFWTDVDAEYGSELEAFEFQLLRLACEALDRGTQARKAIRRHGLVYESAQGSVVARPEVALERSSRAAFASLVRQLGLGSVEPELDEEPEPESGRVRPHSTRRRRGEYALSKGGRMSERSRAKRAAAPRDDWADRTLDRLVDIGGHLLPAYPNHPERRLARSDELIDREVDAAQTRHWYKAGRLNGAARGQRKAAEGDEAYSYGWHSLWQVHPDDRPSAEVEHDFYGALQEWLAVNLPFLTLEACKSVPARRVPGSRLRVPGNGQLYVAEEEPE